MNGITEKERNNIIIVCRKFMDRNPSKGDVYNGKRYNITLADTDGYYRYFEVIDLKTHNEYHVGYDPSSVGVLKWEVELYSS